MRRILIIQYVDYLTQLSLGAIESIDFKKKLQNK